MKKQQPSKDSNLLELFRSDTIYGGLPLEAISDTHIDHLAHAMLDCEEPQRQQIRENWFNRFGDALAAECQAYRGLT